MTPPDDLLNPGAPDGGISMDDFASDFGSSTEPGEFDMPPPPPAPRPSRAQSVSTAPAPEVQVTINKGSPREKAGPPPRDPLAWLSDAKDGMLRFVRRADKAVDSHGRARRGKFKGQYVGIGECGITEVMPPGELQTYIIDNWGGGTYTVEHILDGKKTRDTPPIVLPQDPQPIEGVSTGDDDEDEEIDIGFLNQPQAPPQSQYQPPVDQYGRPIFPPGTQLDQFGRPFQVPQQAPAPFFTPPWLQQNMDEERSGLRDEVEQEREARRKAEQEAARAAAQRERDLERAEAQRAADRMAAELQALKDALTRPKEDSGMNVMLQMMIKQQEAAQVRYEQEAKERRERDEKEAKEAKAREERERQDRRDREEKAEKERRERDERLEKERREDRRLQQEMAAAEAKRSQEFMQLVLGQKTDPLQFIKLMNEQNKNQTDPLKTLDTAFGMVERVQQMGGGRDDDDEPKEGGIAGALRAAVPAFRPIAEAFAKGMAGPPPPPQYYRPQVPIQQVGPNGQPMRPMAPQIPQQPAAQAPPQQSGGVDPQLLQVAKIVGVAGKGFKNETDVEVTAAAMLGMADAFGLAGHIDQLAKTDITEIHTQLTMLLNMGLPADASAQVQSFLDVYNAPGGRAWIKELLDELAGVEEEEDEAPEAPK